ncbi:transcriptional regulator FtrA [Oharaeibacter diazotrophicus]|uniref:AraC family transcriptional regulator with amidase-like domain n=2 Tax=Oharaeibacter diazotrophicus TaxID=1920512 RepID=A0A4V3CVD4_9HYPH|nr:transcriptional regulator FtrA [Oharaeibacter diazotrophicus]TDP82028.1 AraC family transcriptional regulator with amidase-like domain [Oharaeibacter diazotrophicus]BBE73660.1 HTH-type transcriptional regulator CdhR [Pleomorphomonas sp. SM30]
MTTSVEIAPNPHATLATDAAPAGPLVVVLAYDGLCTFEFGVACEMFALPRPEMGPGWYRYRVAAVEPGPLRAAGGLTVAVEAGLEALAEAHTIVVPGWRGIDAPVPAALTAALVAARARGARVMSLCSGIAVLAAAGLLDGRRATTHWRYAAAVAARHPAVTVDADVLYVDAGGVLTAAGSAAGIDLCLHVIRSDFGVEAANRVARRLVVPPHREGGQAQFVEAPVPREREGARLGALIDHLRAALAEDHDLASMAARAGMSVRTFQRRFEAATGSPPGAWLVAERVRRARELLESRPTIALDDVAAACGFADAAALRHHFRTRLGTSPTAYRRLFAP